MCKRNSTGQNSTVPGGSATVLTSSTTPSASLRGAAPLAREAESLALKLLKKNRILDFATFERDK